MNIFRLFFWTGPIFLWNGLRLFLFVMSLAPGFVCFAWYYFVMANRVSVRYGHNSIRQTLDVYRPNRSCDSAAATICTLLTAEQDGSDDNDHAQRQQQCLEAATPSAPVVVFYTGGGWMYVFHIL
jgi:acetyl esterase/lipase